MLFTFSCKKESLIPDTNLIPITDTITILVPRPDTVTLHFILKLYQPQVYDSISIIGMFDPGSRKPITVVGENSEFYLDLDPWFYRGHANIVINPNSGYKYYTLTRIN
jgi:hypothetical protein